MPGAGISVERMVIYCQYFLHSQFDSLLQVARGLVFAVLVRYMHVCSIGSSTLGES